MGNVEKFAYFTNLRWRTAAILEIEKLQYLRNRSTDRDEILQEHAAVSYTHLTLPTKRIV